ncbi:MAG: PilZ domain-containing protein, partial [Sandaracinaceae bacterium]|nr:PilZ domain-containing protein [Sandaracinaceae bacterium]
MDFSKAQNLTTIERRAPSAPRIPVDLLVNLHLLDEQGQRADDECFQAEALDISAAGMRLCSDVLPEAGQRLLCRF